MKLGPVTKIGKRNKTTSSQKIDVIAIFSIYGQFEAIRKLDSGCIICKSSKLFSSIVTFYLIKTENRTKRSLTQLPNYCFSKGIVLAKKR